jgi:hypothetical protein
MDNCGKFSVLTHHISTKGGTYWTGSVLIAHASELGNETI